MSRQFKSVRKPRDILNLGPVDWMAFRDVVQRFSARFWDDRDAEKENDYGVFHSTRHVVLRFVSDSDDLSTTYANPLWHVAAPLLEPEMMRLAARYELSQPCISKAMFARLKAGAHIDLHTDAARGNYYSHKIHIPLQTSEEVMFQVGETRAHLAVGHAYEVNNVRPHGAFNPTSEDRIHFIFEVFDAAGVVDEA